ALHLSAVLAHAREPATCADRRYVESIHRARDPERGRKLRRDPLPRSERHRLPLSALDVARLVHVTREHHRRARRQDGARDRDHLHAVRLAHSRAQAESRSARHAPGGRRMNAVTPIIAIDARANDARLANAIRFLAADAVEKAKSGHPGMPMGMAEIAV